MERDSSPKSDQSSPCIDSGWIPFEFISESAPIVAFLAQINGDDRLWLTLDTGNASGLHISEIAAKRLKLDMSASIANEGNQLSVGSDFVPSAFESAIESVSIGRWNVSRQPVMVSNYVDYLASQLGSRCEGNLGFDWLGHLCITIDYPGMRIRFSDQSSSAQNHTSFELGTQPWIIIEARVNNTEPMKFILDTGAGGTLIDPEVAMRLGLELGGCVDMMGATGMDTARFTHIESLRIGIKTQQNMMPVVADIMKPLSAAAGVELSGIIGFDFFGDSVLTLNYPLQHIGFQ